MKSILMCSSQGNQKALAHKITEITTLNDIILVNINTRIKMSLLFFLRFVWKKICVILTGLKYRSVWFGMLNYYESQYSDFPIQPTLIVSDINDDSVNNKIADTRPDLVIVSGTNLLGSSLIEEILKYGKVINLHTGISPYIKGGPNCTNWCLALREFGLIGNSVMWLNKGIDSGNLIATERTPISGSESLLNLHIAVMEHGHDLYIKCIDKFIKGEILPNVCQNDFPTKRCFLSKHWGLFQMVLGLLNFYLLFKKNSRYLKIPNNIRLIGFKS